MSRTLWRGGPVFTGAEVIPDGAVIAAGDRVEWAGARADAPPAAADETVELGGRLLAPGLVNAHTHVYSALARGIALKDPPPTTFVETLERLWWRLDRALALDDIALSAQLHGLACLRAGVTTIFDHHASERAVRGSLRTLAEALEPLGLRACLCFEVTDREGPEIAAAGIEENAAFLESLAPAGQHHRRGLFGLHAAFTLGDGTLARCATEGQRLSAGFHVHLAESRFDAGGSAARLEAAGVLGPRTLAVHGVHLDDEALAIVARTRTRLVHCPESNMNNAVGAARLDRLHAAGARVALGTDGFTAHVPREALVATLLQSHASGDSGAGWRTVPRLLLDENPALASETFGVPLGTLAPGAAADLVVWEYVPPTPITTANLWGHVLFGLAPAGARDVWIAGRRVLAEGRPTGLDEGELAAQCRRAAAALWERF